MSVEDLFKPDVTDSTTRRLIRGTQLFETLKTLDSAAIAEDAIDGLEPEGLRSIVLAQLYNVQQRRMDNEWGQDADGSPRPKHTTGAQYDRWCTRRPHPA